jgi:hypothetical protein
VDEKKEFRTNLFIVEKEFSFSYSLFAKNLNELKNEYNVLKNSVNLICGLE